MKINVSYLLSYDYGLFITSVKQLYDHVDKIVVAIDSERKTWSGNIFQIPESFFEEVKRFDIKNKIEFYFDIFYLPELSPIECDTRERNLVSKKMGKGWLIQIDVDEYVYDFKKIVKYLKCHWYLLIFPKLTPIVFRAKWITLFKQLPQGFLYIDNNETFPLITNIPYYDYCRENKKNRNHQTFLAVIHQSWARSDDEILMKMKNWGHRDDFDIIKYYEFWKSINLENYKNYKNFHPVAPEVWNELHFLKSNSIDDFIEKYASHNFQNLFYIEAKVKFKAIFNKLRM
ncbi:hypothetical protein [Flavobacterium gawalongense]|uniref:Glycosyl transferase family 2 n=1 Tax=Flavobacterium gawalongense TaxID=2594432 RepID=A0A553BZ90_9FLAO|nr:hypothetical protein [Flavobacterium gawalongense]TRX13476.1 hypothetical protein FNW11_01065 [Flavobacterium gawalongense]TRX15592.1 hypothetical protein FNW10_00625 [Flavobacterium gawalongense]TRX31430.1 hypothetical protein FNW38_00625 [Flavobacterium gawalongense]